MVGGKAVLASYRFRRHALITSRAVYVLAMLIDVSRNLLDWRRTGSVFRSSYVLHVEVTTLGYRSLKESHACIRGMVQLTRLITVPAKIDEKLPSKAELLIVA